MHLAWDVMVGLGTLLALLSVWYGLSWVVKRDFPKTKWFLRIAASTGVLSVVTMEAGWVVTEVGRQPWIVHDYMKVEQAATANTGVWITFLAVVGDLRGPRRHDDPRAARDEPALAGAGRGRRDRRALRTERSRQCSGRAWHEGH